MGREYATVKARSSNHALLMAAHEKVICEPDAINTIYAYVDEHEVTVAFTGKNNGRCHYGAPCRITLPPTGSKYLTVGLTLHELAHALLYIDKQLRNHCDEFVRTLDALVVSEKNWKKEPKL